MLNSNFRQFILLGAFCLSYRCVDASCHLMMSTHCKKTVLFCVSLLLRILCIQFNIPCNRIEWHDFVCSFSLQMREHTHAPFDTNSKNHVERDKIIAQIDHCLAQHFRR